MTPLTLEQLEKTYGTNAHRLNVIAQLKEELAYWQAVTSALQVWVYGPFLGMTEEPDINVLLFAVLKPADPSSPRRVKRPNVQVHFRLGKDTVKKDDMIRTFNEHPQNVDNGVKLRPEQVHELALGGAGTAPAAPAAEAPPAPPAA
jgi:hypothetical protein